KQGTPGRTRRPAAATGTRGKAGCSPRTRRAATTVHTGTDAGSLLHSAVANAAADSRHPRVAATYHTAFPAATSGFTAPATAQTRDQLGTISRRQRFRLGRRLCALSRRRLLGEVCVREKLDHA